MIKTKEEMFLAEIGIHTETIIEGDYTAKYKLKDLLKKYAEQCNIANVVGQSEQLECKCPTNPNTIKEEIEKNKCFECGLPIVAL